MFIEHNVTSTGEVRNTSWEIHRRVKKRCNDGMNKKDIRTRRLADLIRDRYADNVSAFARAIDRSSSQLNDTLAGRKSFGEKFARYVEQKLGLKEGWLDAVDMQSTLRASATLTGTLSDANTAPAPDIVGRIPLISWVQAGAFCQVVDLFEPGDAEEWLPTIQTLGPRAYALRVRGDSMTAPYGRTYPDGVIIYVDPDAAITNGCRVIAKLPDSDEATFKVYSEDAGQRYLKPLNAQYPTITMTPDMRLCGVVKGSYWPE